MIRTTGHKAKQRQLFEIATFYNISELRDEELMMLVLDRVPAKTKEMVLATLRRLLAERGGLTALLHMEIEELIEVFEDELVATRIKALLVLATRIAKPKPQLYQIRSADDAARLVRNDLMHLEHEEMHILVLDTKNQVVHWDRRYKGTVNSSVLRIAEVFKPAIIRGCPRLIVCHNHPSGDPSPSAEDIYVTRQLAEAGKLLDVELLDHVIIGNPRYLSLKEKISW